LGADAPGLRRYASAREPMSRDRDSPAESTSALAHAGRLDDTLAFLRLFWEVDHEMRAASKRMRAKLGVTGPERLVIRMLGEFQEMSSGELAALLHLHPSTLTVTINRLVRRGLIDRRADERDARRAVLSLTPAGRRLDRLRSDTLEARVRHALAQLPKHKVACVRDVLGALARELARDAPRGRRNSSRFPASRR
jgi:DNA-binding MarR family transcriptional regulator